MVAVCYAIINQRFPQDSFAQSCRLSKRERKISLTSGMKHLDRSAIIANNVEIERVYEQGNIKGACIMTCFYCKGNIETSTTTYMTDYQGCYIIIKNVPCEKCTQCGEEYLNGETLEKIEEIIEKVKGMLTEIAVVDYKQTA